MIVPAFNRYKSTFWIFKVFGIIEQHLSHIIFIEEGLYSVQYSSYVSNQRHLLYFSYAHPQAQSVQLLVIYHLLDSVQWTRSNITTENAISSHKFLLLIWCLHNHLFCTTLFGLAGSKTGNEYRTLSNYFSFAKTPCAPSPALVSSAL